MRVFACLRPRRTKRSGVGAVCEALFCHKEVFAHILEVMPEARMLADDAWLGCDGSMRKRRIVNLAPSKPPTAISVFIVFIAYLFAPNAGKPTKNTIPVAASNVDFDSIDDVPLIIRSLCSPKFQRPGIGTYMRAYHITSHHFSSPLVQYNSICSTMDSY
jgi:hypothetical protein